MAHRQAAKIVVLVSSWFLVTSLPGLASAESQAFAERSKVIAKGNQIFLYGLPTKNSSGDVTKYYDVTVTLNVGGAGKPNSRAGVEVAQPPGVDQADFAEGLYLRETAVCQLSAEPSGGRTAVSLNCVRNADPSDSFDFLWFTGPIDETHPAKARLDAVGIGRSAANDLLAWGTVNGSEGNSQFITPCSLGVNQVISARQIDSVLIVTLYNSTGAVACSFTAVNDAS
jgi:hypothetical protein